MKKWADKIRDMKSSMKAAWKVTGMALAACVMLTGCSGKEEDSGEEATDRTIGTSITDQETITTTEESSRDIRLLKEENGDIFAWLYIPGTDIDYPVFQSGVADDYYESHDAGGSASEEGALYIEMGNAPDMCDFNTVIRGKTDASGRKGLFHELYNFSDKDFFMENGLIYLYLEDNKLTYQIFAAYEREDSSLIRDYDFSSVSGSQEFLDGLYTREMGKNILEEWDKVTPYNFLITLTTRLGDGAGRQYVVVAALVEDEAGTIDRPYME